MGNFNFKSQPATSIEQSERLLALGLKKETADMKYPCTREYYGGVLTEGTSSLPVIIDTEDDDITEYDIPAWSIGRLIEMLQHCQYEGKQDGIFVHGYFPFPQLISVIDYLIGIGKFNKEYLEE